MARLNRTLILSYRIFVLSNTAGRGQCNAPDVEIAGDGSADGRRGRSRGAQEGTEPEGAVGRPAPRTHPESTSASAGAGDDGARVVFTALAVPIGSSGGGHGGGSCRRGDDVRLVPPLPDFVGPALLLS